MTAEQTGLKRARHRVYSFKREYNTADMGTIRVRDDVGTIHEFAATLAEREPEVVLLPNEPFEFEEQHKDEVQSAIWKSVPGCRVVLLEGSFLTWWGARTLPALSYLSEIRRGLCDRNP
ncbi:MAG: hypothetical protein KAJ37_12250 [Candidatus Krumholzibacteria bacterium]|nr:hypothetical protein [Candidatus Krumholzibacteria bacterium]